MKLKHVICATILSFATLYNAKIPELYGSEKSLDLLKDYDRNDGETISKEEEKALILKEYHHFKHFTETSPAYKHLRNGKLRHVKDHELVDMGAKILALIFFKVDDNYTKEKGEMNKAIERFFITPVKNMYDYQLGLVKRIKLNKYRQLDQAKLRALSSQHVDIEKNMYYQLALIEHQMLIKSKSEKKLAHFYSKMIEKYSKYINEINVQSGHRIKAFNYALNQYKNHGE